MRYTLDNINDIIYGGFNYELPEKTLKIISELSLQVGSPDYVRTPIFLKRENPLKTNESNQSLKDNQSFKRKKGSNKSMEISNNDWETLKTFQTTKIEQKNGINAQIDNIRTCLNKLTDKNYIDIRNKIFDIIDQIISENVTNDEMLLVSTTIFDIASTNRFYSKIYAELYSDLASKYEIMKETFEESLDKFMGLFNIIEYVDPKVNYDRFCEINKINEKRKSLGTFFLNLMTNGIISKEKIISITRNLLVQIYTFISEENKKNEVDELTENVALLYRKELYNNKNDKSNLELIDGFTINQMIEKMANSKVKDYVSLTNKSVFRFMDLIDM